MKNVSSLKPSSKSDSPKTPGGISKSLLTPCRRVGLSRNFRKSGASPFQSPLSSNTGVTQVKVETRKRKESLEETPQTPEINVCKTTDVVSTPTRNVELPRRKKSKTLLATLNKANEEPDPETLVCVSEHNLLELNKELSVNENSHKEGEESEMQSKTKESVATPVRLKSKTKCKKKISPSKHIEKVIHSENEIACTNKTVETEDNTKVESELLTNEKSPNNLTKECIVVIQKKLFKKELKETQKPPKSKDKKCSNLPIETSPQTLFDSDTDDVPLVQINKETIKKPLSKSEDDDFVLNKSIISKPDTKPSKTKSPSTIKNKKNRRVLKVDVHKPSQSSGDDDDDFMEKKRTIIVRKSYDKVLKPQKAKSTGSITQKDIDDLKARIETKKKMLLAKAMTEDTKELRDLIKRWQKGCQEALMELMDLMKNKFPDKQNMDYSEILKTLKIPASMVGYDSDQECFLTPDDENIILAKV